MAFFCSPAFAGHLVVLNVLALVLMGVDKRRAKRHAWRIPEATFFAVALLGGSAGAWAGMYLFRHKTRHWYFVVGFWALLLVHIALTVLLVYTGALRLP